jgi:hypothetical protein
MSTTAKTGIALVIILVLLVIGWIVVSDKPVETPTDVAVQSVAPTPTPKLPNTAGTGLSDVSDTTNEALDTDLKAVGTQMDALSNDNATLDQSLKETI